MSEITKRVTKAVFLAIIKKLATDPICPAEEVGREAIAAIRDPTPEMIAAAREMVFADAHRHKIGLPTEVENALYKIDFSKIFQAMIDEALK